jgi:transcription elongation factor S-II
MGRKTCVRERATVLLHGALGTPASRSIACGLECALHTRCDTMKSYKSKIRIMCALLRRNESIRSSVCDGKTAPGALCDMAPSETLTPSQQVSRKRARAESLHRSTAAVIPMAESDEFKCGRCKKQRTVYFQKQTRCADEPMTTFVRCLECGHNWKFS